MDSSTDTRDGATIVAEQMIMERLPSLVNALFEVALGTVVERVGKDGKRYTVKMPPCRKAITYLLDWVFANRRNLRPVVNNSSEMSTTSATFSGYCPIGQQDPETPRGNPLPLVTANARRKERQAKRRQLHLGIKNAVTA